jgi:hypothetical protein
VTVPQKTALSLLVSVVLAAVFSILAFTGFFNKIETSTGILLGAHPVLHISRIRVK